MNELYGKSQVHRRSYFKCIYLYVCVCTYKWCAYGRHESLDLNQVIIRLGGKHLRPLNN